MYFIVQFNVLMSSEHLYHLKNQRYQMCPTLCNTNHISARPSQGLTCSSFPKKFNVSACLSKTCPPRSADTWSGLRLRVCVKYNSVSKRALQGTKLKSGEMISSNDTEIVEAEACGVWGRLQRPRTGPVRLSLRAERHRGGRREQWLSLFVCLAVQSHKMSSPYEADHCSLSCFPFTSFHRFKQPVLLAVSLTCLSPQAPQQPFNTNIKTSH